MYRVLVKVIRITDLNIQSALVLIREEFRNHGHRSLGQSREYHASTLWTLPDHGFHSVIEVLWTDHYRVMKRCSENLPVE